jgi:hypothetical protein
VKVLLFTSKEEDYLQDSVIHGFKKLFGKNVIDYPAKDILYNDYQDLNSIRGNGFTLYGLLDSNLKAGNEINIEKGISENKFELIVFTSIYRQYEIFYKYLHLLTKVNIPVWIMDGEDSPVLFPYLGKHLKNFFGAIKPHKHFRYFKRELLPETLNSIYLRFPVSKFGIISFPENIKPVSFSMPAEKIVTQPPIKTKLFAGHIVDDEVAIKVYGQAKKIIFNKEEDYYKDIQTSKFGITTKRAGWDCLRHYEIAANGTVICFKNLKDKPDSCAPHGLIDGKNCIFYSDYSDLKNKINNLTDDKYSELQLASLKWIKNNSTVSCISNLISNYC